MLVIAAHRVLLILHQLFDQPPMETVVKEPDAKESPIVLAHINDLNVQAH